MIWWWKHTYKSRRVFCRAKTRERKGILLWAHVAVLVQVWPPTSRPRGKLETARLIDRITGAAPPELLRDKGDCRTAR